MPTILTTVAEKTFSGPMFDEIVETFRGQKMIDRTSMNTWEDANVIKEVNRIGKNRLVFAGLWTSVCIVGPTLSALDQGFEAYVIADAFDASGKPVAIAPRHRQSAGPHHRRRADGQSGPCEHL